MKTLYFKCTLLTDVVINQKAATEGNQNSLDFIPGNNFLGIAASQLYASSGKEEALKLFHSETVRFGDAHPVIMDESGRIRRSLRIPACFYKPKLKPIDEVGFYVSHEVKEPDKPEYKDFQPKQCRTGFYVFEDHTLFEVEVHKSFAIKSAYERKNRRSADAQMFGYESLDAGSHWVFDVTIADEVFEGKIRTALAGRKKIGRSRTAQYGLIDIEEIKEAPKCIESLNNNAEQAFVYADARLIFLDEYGLPTFQPQAENLGFKGGVIDWEKTQIRTFQYAPWNFKRQARDADRCGIEKGSVFVIKKDKNAEWLIYPGTNFVGSYQNEGFGKVIINPAFLQTKEGSNGKSIYILKGKDEQTKEKKTIPVVLEEIKQNSLFVFLKAQKERNERDSEIYELVNLFTEKDTNLRAFSGDDFASQWGAIRSIAMTAKSKENLRQQLFERKSGYLTHGIALEKWGEQGRLAKFTEFFDKVYENNKFSDRDVCSIIINLSAEMAKKAKRK